MESAIDVLVIDDDAVIRDILKRWFEREGFSVRLAENGLVGVEMQRSTPADVIICDLIMPEQEGIETITQLCKEHPETGIIAISGGGKVDPSSYLSAAGHLGAWKSFCKPLPMEQVVEAIRQWVAGDR